VLVGVSVLSKLHQVADGVASKSRAKESGQTEGS